MSNDEQTFEEGKKASGFVLTQAIVDFVDKAFNNTMLLVEKRIKEHPELAGSSDAAKELVCNIAISCWAKHAYHLSEDQKTQASSTQMETFHAAEDEISSFKRMVSILEKTSTTHPRDIIIARTRSEALEIVKKKLEEAQGEDIPQLGFETWKDMRSS